MKIAVILDPLPTLKIYKDSTYAIMREAEYRDHEVFVLGQQDILLKDHVVLGRAQSLHIKPDAKDWYTLGPVNETALRQFDVVLMRKDPPVDLQYTFTTHLLELAEVQGARVLNRPQALRDFNEKLAIEKFPQFIAPSLVTSNATAIGEFLAQHHDIILKPLDGMGGAGIFRVKEGDQNFNVIVESVTQLGTRSAMAQRYIPEIASGDKRILVIDGAPVPYALARIPKPGEARGNLAAGGRGVVQALNERDWEIANIVGPYMRQAGLFLVGLDVIGDYLTEINVTSPTCLQEIALDSPCKPAAMVLDALQAFICITP